MPTKSPVSTTPEEEETASALLDMFLTASYGRLYVTMIGWQDTPSPNLNLFITRELLTWNHLDRGVDFLPVLSVLKLPVQDEVAVVSDHRTLRDRQTDATQTSATDLNHSQGSLYPNLVHQRETCQQHLE